MYHWLLVSMTTTDATRARAALHQAARRTHFDDYIGAGYRAFADAFAAAAVPVPSLIAGPVAVLAPEERAEPSVAMLEANRSIVLPRWNVLIRQCGVAMGSTLAEEPQLRADCLTVGERLARSTGGIISQMIGVALVRNLARETPLAEEMKQVRRRYQYLQAMDDGLSPRQRMTYSTARYFDNIARFGEMAAFQRRIEFFGMPGLPPADWQPDDLNLLLSARERIDNLIAIHAAADDRVAQGQYTEAIAMLAPVEAATRKYLDSENAWRVPRFLMALGKARMAVGEFPAARANLFEAWETVEKYGPASPDLRQCALAIVDLFRTWDAAEPEKGHAAKLAEWQAKVDKL